MITTRNINVNLDKGKLKLRHITTKDIDAGIRVEPPKVPIKTKSITTTTLADVADIAEKKRRDDIMAEKKLAMKDKKKIVMVELTKKPWKEMTDDEKKVAMKERTVKMMATKARKKKEMKIEVETTARYADDKGEPKMAITEPMKKEKEK